MSARKLLLLTAVVFLLFAFILFFERKMPTTSERQSKGNLHWDIPPDRVVSIRLERPDSVVELAKDGENWRIVQPSPYPADSFAASDLARDLAQLRNPGEEAPDAKPEEYGLAKPAAKATFAWTDDPASKQKSSRTVEFGIDLPGTDIAAARIAGTSRVLFVPSSVAAAVKKPATDFQSKDVFGGSSIDVSRIDLERGRGHLVLAQRAGSWWMEQPLKDLADGEAASRLSGDLTGLRVIEFVAADKAALATYGLSPPLYRVMVADAKGKTTAVEFGATRSDGNTVYGRRESQVFTVSSSIVEELSKEAVAFRDTHLIRFDRATVSGLEGTFGADHFSLARGKDGGWLVGGKPQLAGAVDELMTALLEIKTRAFLDDAEAQGLAGRTSSATIRITASGDEPWVVQAYGGPGEPAATVSRRPGGFRLAADAISGLPDAFRKATTIVVPTVAAPTPAAKPARPTAAAGAKK